MSHVTFPGLGLEFDINCVAFSIKGYDVYWYGILIAFGVLLGIIYATRNAAKFGVDEDKLMDVIIVAAICAVISGRAFYVIFNADYHVDSVKEFFNIRGGGTAFYGVLLGALLSSFIVCKIRKIKYRCLLDDLAVGFLVGQGIGRWGNFMNQELFGTNTDLPWGMYSDTIASYIRRNSGRLLSEHGIVLNEGPVHPTFLYESIWCFIGLFIILRVIKKRRFDGQVFLTYLIWNGIGRGFTESLRTDALFLGRIRISQFVCITLAMIGFISLLVINRRIKYQGDDDYMKCYVLTEEWASEYQTIKQRSEAESARIHAFLKGERKPVKEESEALTDADIAVLAAAGMAEDEELTSEIVDDQKADESSDDIELSYEDEE